MMQIVVETAKRWRLPLVCLAWMLGLSGLLVGRGYETFLAANFLPVVALAAVALAPMALCSLLRRSSPRLGAKEALGTAIILLPLVYIHHSLGTTLGAGAFNARYVGTGPGGGSAAPVRGGPGAETSLLALFTEPEKYDGVDVAAVGMLAKDNRQVEEILGEKLPLVFRFVVNCCTADAMPVALVLEGGGAERLENDAWIEASGTFRIRNVGGQELLVLENARIAAAAKPAQPYLYMQWGAF